MAKPRKGLARFAGRFRKQVRVEVPLRTRLLAAPLQVTDDGVLGWFVWDPFSWRFETIDRRVTIWDGWTARLGQLAEAVDVPNGRPIQLRRTTRPYAAYEWAAERDRAAVPLTVDDGGDAWNDYLKAWNDYLELGQRRLRSTGLDEKLTMVGVWLGPVPPKDQINQLVPGDGVAPGKEAAEILDRLAETTEVMAGGLNGRPATAEELSLLLHRSLSMGVPPPGKAGLNAEVLEGDELGEFTSRSAWVVSPLGRSVEVLSEHDAVATSRHVVVLSMGPMPEMTWPESGQDPWMLASDRLGFPIEWSLHGALQKGSVVEPAAVYDRRRAEAIREDYADHGMTPPPAVNRAIDAAITTLDEVTEGDTRTAPRFVGAVRAAVVADSLEEAERRARRLQVFYKDLMRMPMTRTLDQARALREFVPGGPRVEHGFTRRMPVSYLAAAGPHIDEPAGTPTGPYLGYSSITHRAFLYDPHWAPENNRPGLVTVFGEPGSGKSFLSGAMAYNLVRAGVPTVMVDPSGPLAKLTQLPELAPYSSVLNLMRADEGTLSPCMMIPSPRRTEYGPGEDAAREYLLDERRARAERAELSVDVLRMLLPPSLMGARGVDQRLTAAVRSMEHHVDAGRVPRTMWNLRWALEYLGRRADDLGRELLEELEAATDFPGAQLIIPTHSGPVEDAELDEKKLVVITMPGLTPPPPGEDPAGWSIGERQAVPLLHLGTFLAARSVYSRPATERKAVFLDEGDAFLRHRSARALLNRLSSDSRKKNGSVWLASQAPDDQDAAGQRVESLISGVFAGRLSKRAAAERVCARLGAPVEFAPVIQTLDSGEFVVADPLGRIEKIRVDGDWHPSLRAALLTTPGATRAVADDGPVPPARIDPRLVGAA